MSTRVRSINTTRVAAHLRAAGVDPAYGPVTDTAMNGGCTDPGCCPQHPAHAAPDEWVQFTSATGAQVHRAVLAVRADDAADEAADAYWATADHCVIRGMED